MDAPTGNNKKRGRPPKTSNSEPAAKRPYKAKMCKHDRRANRCSLCSNEGKAVSGICNHGVQRYRCTQCMGTSICEHGNVRNMCVDCGGICLCLLCSKARHRCICTLPQAFLDLELLLEKVIRILATAKSRSGTRGTPLKNLQTDMLTSHGTSFTIEHLNAILVLVPDCIQVSRTGQTCSLKLMKFGPGERIIDLQKVVQDMKVAFRQSSLSFVRARYDAFAKTQHPGPAPKFDTSLVQLPTIDLPRRPPTRASTARSNGVEDQAVIITPEIKRAFDLHCAKTMTPVKAKYIKDCSKSALGLQNLEKIQNFELQEFALQEQFKVAQEKNAELKFQTAADALRCLFSHRGKSSLPVADVLKVLRQTRGLAFKSDKDASDMLNAIVERLPNSFSKNTISSQGKNVWIKFSSSDLFPWHQSRVYPQPSVHPKPKL